MWSRICVRCMPPEGQKSAGEVIIEHLCNMFLLQSKGRHWRRHLLGPVPEGLESEDDLDEDIDLIRVQGGGDDSRDDVSGSLGGQQSGSRSKSRGRGSRTGTAAAAANSREREAAMSNRQQQAAVGV